MRSRILRETVGMMNPTALCPLGQQPSVQESRLFVLEVKASQRGGRATAAPRNGPLVRVRILARDAAVLVLAVRAGLSWRIARNLRIVLKVPPVGVPAATAAAHRAVRVRTKVSPLSRGHHVALAQAMDLQVSRGRPAVPVRPNVTVEVRQGSPAAKGRAVASNQTRMVAGIQPLSPRLSLNHSIPALVF